MDPPHAQVRRRRVDCCRSLSDETRRSRDDGMEWNVYFTLRFFDLIIMTPIPLSLSLFFVVFDIVLLAMRSDEFYPTDIFYILRFDD